MDLNISTNEYTNFDTTAQSLGHSTEVISLVNGATTQSLFDFEHPSNHVLSAIVGAIGAVGFPGNLFLIFVILKNVTQAKPQDWLLLNLACIDLLLCFNNMALESQFISNFRNVGCKIAGFCDYFFGMLSFAVPPTIAYNRYLSLYNSTLYKKLFTHRNVLFICFGPWILSFVLFCPFLFTNNLGLDDLGICGTKQSTLALHFMYTFGICPLVFIFYATSLFCGYKVMRKLQQHRNGILSYVPISLVNETIEISWLLSLLLIIPVIAQIPAVIIKLIQWQVRLDPWISRSFSSTFPLTSACNAYLTIFTVKKYKKLTIRMFGFNKTKVQPILVSHLQGRIR